MSKAQTSNSAIGTVDRIYSYIEDALMLISAAAIFFLMFLGVVQVIGRKFFNFPIPGYIDYSEQSIAIFAFLGVAGCQRMGSHVRMELLLDKLQRGRFFWFVELATTFGALLIIVLLVRSSYQHFLRAWAFGDSTMDIGLPVWPSKLLVSLALGVLAGRLLIQLIGFVRLVRFPEAEPIAVPLIAAVHEVATNEAEASASSKEDAQ